MSQQPNFAETLLQILPVLYRTRDDSGDLRAYLEGCGELLDAVYATLRQRHGDNFPDNPPDGAAVPPAQDWLLPYFADLVDARLVSPLPDGRRDELAHAIRWRQGKGTLSVLDGIVEAIGQTEAVVQEGWQRVALTPRLAQPLRPAVSFGYSQEPPAASPGVMAKHPDLPAATVDLRCPSRALATDQDNPGARSIEIDGAPHVWRQGSWHGAPCFPGSYEDVSRRTADLRTPDWRVGHAHPRRILAYLPPPSGFFPPNAPEVAWQPVPSQDYLDLVDVDTSEPGVIVHRNRTLGTAAFVPVIVTGAVALDAAATPGGWRFEGLAFADAVTTGAARIAMQRCAALSVTTPADAGLAPAIALTDCLVETVAAPNGRARLVGVTALGAVAVRAIEASDSLFVAPVTGPAPSTLAPPGGTCIRYSRIAPDQPTDGIRFFATTTEAPVFFETAFGVRHSGVLAPASHDDILTGAEDEGEMGAFHHARHAAIRSAIVTKLSDFLPVGQEAVLIPDSRLSAAPYGAAG